MIFQSRLGLGHNQWQFAREYHCHFAARYVMKMTTFLRAISSSRTEGAKRTLDDMVKHHPALCRYLANSIV